MATLRSGIRLQNSLNILILTGLLFVTPSYASTNFRAESAESREAQTQNQNEKQLVKEELYFGLSKPGGKTISEAEWELFLNRVITPRFKDGLTVIDSYGQYLSSSGTLTKEKTKLVILIYPKSLTKNKLIEEIIAIYKRRFQQESVLRVTSSVRVIVFKSKDNQYFSYGRLTCLTFHGMWKIRKAK
jgi:Protein of unknown function (DUF3574)